MNQCLSKPATTLTPCRQMPIRWAESGAESLLTCQVHKFDLLRQRQLIGGFSSFRNVSPLEVLDRDRLYWDLQVLLPPTLAEAQVLVSVRDEERRKIAARRDKHKQRTSKTKDCSKDLYPGAVPGAEVNKTALWLSTEVRQPD